MLGSRACTTPANISNHLLSLLSKLCPRMIVASSYSPFTLARQSTQDTFAFIHSTHPRRITTVGSYVFVFKKAAFNLESFFLSPYYQPHLMIGKYSQSSITHLINQLYTSPSPNTKPRCTATRSLSIRQSQRQTRTRTQSQGSNATIILTAGNTRIMAVSAPIVW